MTFVRIATLAVVVVSGCTPAVLLPEGELLRDVHVRGSGRVPVYALTFDDGPNGKCTEAALDALRDVGAPGTFFVLGKNVADGRNDEMLARMVREGHAIGVHSESHGVRPLFRRPLTAGELARTRAAVEAALGRAGVSDGAGPRLFRPPFGFLTAASARAAADAGFRIVEWTVSVEDWRAERMPSDVADRIVARVRAGDVVLLHDGNGTHQRSHERCRDRPNAAAAVRLVVPALAARGLRPAPLADVLGLDLSGDVDLSGGAH